MKKNTLILLLIGLFSSTIGQDRIDYNQRLYASYIADEIDQWGRIIEEMSHEYQITDNQTLLYDLCFAYYGYIGFLISEEREKDMAKED